MLTFYFIGFSSNFFAVSQEQWRSSFSSSFRDANMQLILKLHQMQSGPTDDPKLKTFHSGWWSIIYKPLTASMATASLTSFHTHGPNQVSNFISQLCPLCSTSDLFSNVIHPSALTLLVMSPLFHSSTSPGSLPPPPCFSPQIAPSSANIIVPKLNSLFL